MENMQIGLANTINFSYDTTIIPITYSLLTSKTISSLDNKLFNIINKYMKINEKYKPTIKHIETNIIKKEITMASITVMVNTKPPLEQIKGMINNSSGGGNGGGSSKSITKFFSDLFKTKKDYSRYYTKSIPLSRTKKQIGGSGGGGSNGGGDYSEKLHQIYIVVVNDRTYKNDLYQLYEGCRVAGSIAFDIMKNNNIEFANILDVLEDVNTNGITMMLNILEGFLLASYTFTKFKTEHSIDKSQNFTPKKVNLVFMGYNLLVDRKKIELQVKQLSSNLKSVYLARDLINEPANSEKTETFITIVEDYIRKHRLPIKVRIIEEKQLQRMGMGLLLAVGSGSNNNNRPKLLILEYDGMKTRNGGSDHSNNPEYILMGKGITFDTGGLDLKSDKAMIEMKSDLSGAAAVVAFLLGYARSKGEKSIYVMCPFAENSIGPDAMKPSDVVTAYNGMTVEISDTDAEGRLILADVLAYASKEYPNAKLIDMATLTGQQEKVSCKMFSNVLQVNNEVDTKLMIEAGRTVNEALVELPMMDNSVDNHLEKLKSYVADIKNVSFTCSADIIMSGLFMKQFIGKKTKWIHVDIAGPSFKNSGNIKYMPGEASGIGVRLLFEFFKKL